MLRNITCKCAGAVGYYDSASGVIRHAAMPSGISVFGCYLQCKNCGRWFKFNGERIRRSEQKKALREKTF